MLRKRRSPLQVPGYLKGTLPCTPVLDLRLLSARSEDREIDFRQPSLAYAFRYSPPSLGMPRSLAQSALITQFRSSQFQLQTLTFLRCSNKKGDHRSPSFVFPPCLTRLSLW